VLICGVFRVSLSLKNLQIGSQSGPDEIWGAIQAKTINLVDITIVRIKEA
jgi:hypothetical protein